MVEVTGRRRDPDRRRRILDAAAALVAEHGYHDVGMADIGAAAGITGSAIYRHFEGKSAVLVTMFERVLDELAGNATRIVGECTRPHTALCALIRDHLRFVVDDRTLMQVYYREFGNLPAGDRHRLRAKQVRYVDAWVRQLTALRPGATDAELRARVHAPLAAIQSVLHYRSELPAGPLADLIAASAEAALLTPG